MTDFRTLVALSPVKWALTPSSHLLFLGSCFAENVGRHCYEALPETQVSVNPFGVLYNPESLRLALDILLNGSLFFPDDYLFEGSDGLWHSWLHSSIFSSPDRATCAAQIRNAYEAARATLLKADALVVTMGTSHTYIHRERGHVVGNCHKEGAQYFTERILSIHDIVEKWQPLLGELACEIPRLKIIFTVSPDRYAKYGFHENQLSKSTLLLAIDTLCKTHTNAFYFPAYEIVLDELRDYRFYKDDMLHPSAQATAYVWQRFQDWLFSPELQKFCNERAKIINDLSHRPLHPDSEAHRKFLAQLEKRQRAFQKKWKTAAPNA